MKSNTSSRIDSLDYVRGLMALSVVFYHYTHWAFGGESFVTSDYILGRLGVYAVSIFYILSGASLACVYNKKINNLEEINSFSVRRVFRIFPLFWLATTITISLSFLSSYISGDDFLFPLHKAIINYTLVFGFISPSSYIATGAWSIGNEMVFYAIFCITLYVSSKNKNFFSLVFIASIIAGIYFSFFIINHEVKLSEQWGEYINPMNQLFLFMSGAALYKIRNIKINKTTIHLGLPTSIIVFCLIPASGDLVHVVHGYKRVFLSLSCISAVFFIMKINTDPNNIITIPLSFLGRVSYSVYLLHPPVSSIFIFSCKLIGLEGVMYYYLSIPFVLFASHLSYKYIETPMISFGRMITKSNT